MANATDNNLAKQSLESELEEAAREMRADYNDPDTGENYPIYPSLIKYAKAIDQARERLAKQNIPEGWVAVPREMLGGLLTDLHNITYTIEYVGDYYATKNGPMYGYSKNAQEKLRALLAASPSSSS